MKKIIIVGMFLLMTIGICFASTPAQTKLHYWEVSQLVPVKKGAEHGILFQRMCSRCGLKEVYFINIHHTEVKCPVRVGNDG